MQKESFLIYIWFLGLVLMGCAVPPVLTKSLEPDKTLIGKTQQMDPVDQFIMLTPIIIEPPEKKPDRNRRSIQLDEVYPDYFNYEIMNILKDEQQVFPELLLFPKGLSRQEMIGIAGRLQASYLLTITIKNGCFYYAGNSRATAGNTVLWFMLGIPSFWTHDQVYGIKIDAEISFVDLKKDAEIERYLKDINLSKTYKLSLQKEGGVNFLERGFSPYIFFLPPQLCPRNWAKMEQQVLPKVKKLLIRSLAESIKEIASGLSDNQ